MTEPKEPRPLLRVLTGATASGKTDVALTLAERHGFEIVAADSMSVYRRMDIGTAKPGPEQRQRVRHWCLDLVEPSEDFDSARFVAEADRAIADVTARGGRVLVAGGTPLYLMALLRGFFDGPSADPGLRAELTRREDESPGSLHAELSRIDPEAAARIHTNDRKRLVRALEVWKLCGRPISELQRQFEEGPPRYPYRAVRLSWSRDTLQARVRARTTAMLARGLIDEVRAIRDDCGFGRTASAAIGYHEALRFLAGELSAEELPYRIRSATHRLVRRQDTWFRRFPELRSAGVEGHDTAGAARVAEAALLTGSRT